MRVQLGRGFHRAIAGLALLAIATATMSAVTAAPAAAATTADVKINEVESNNGTPGDWVELYNAGTGSVDISGLIFRDNDNTHTYAIPASTTLAQGAYYMLEEAAFGFGLGSADSARLFDTNGTTLLDSYSWTAHAANTYGRCPNGTGAFTSTTSTKGAANACPATTADVKINEVESNGGTPGDWVELYNAGSTSVDISGLKFLDNDNGHTPYAIPASTILAAGGYYLLEEAAFGFGLGSADSARLYATDGATLLDSYSWTSHAAVTYGRCPNGTGAFTSNATSTKGAANDCGTVATTTTTPSGALPWPGDAAVATASNYVFGGDLSGLMYEGSGSATPGMMWGVKNGTGALFRLTSDGTNWAPDTANDWGAGKLLHYPGGSGVPDSEGVTFATSSSSGGIYVATERNNSANSISRNSVLRFDPGAAGTSLTATNEWDLTADLPVTGANLGLEGITWIPDSFLTSKSFFDEHSGHTYVPSEYANHGTGLFFVGLEANGTIYAYALDQTGSGFTRVATILSGFPSVMDLQFDRDIDDLWAVCDDGCQGRHTVLRISPSTGKFVVSFLFDRPAGMPNLNNEGFAIAAATECVNDRKPVFWADDAETDGHSIRRGNIPCTALTGGAEALVPEFPLPVLSAILVVLVFGAWMLVRVRRRRLA